MCRAAAAPTGAAVTLEMMDALLDCPTATLESLPVTQLAKLAKFARAQKVSK